MYHNTSGTFENVETWQSVWQKSEFCQSTFRLSLIEAEPFCCFDKFSDQIAAFKLFLAEWPVVEHPYDVAWSRPGAFGILSLRPYSRYLSCSMISIYSCQLGERSRSGVQDE